MSEWVAGELFRSCNKATLRKSEAGVEIRVGLFSSQIYSFNLMRSLDSEIDINWNTWCLTVKCICLHSSGFNSRRNLLILQACRKYILQFIRKFYESSLYLCSHKLSNLSSYSSFRNVHFSCVIALKFLSLLFKSVFSWNSLSEKTNLYRTWPNIQDNSWQNAQVVTIKVNIELSELLLVTT